MNERVFLSALAIVGIFILLQPSQPSLLAQFRGEPSGIEHFGTDFIGAVNDVCDWYDAPLFAIYLVNRYDFIAQESKPIVIGPSDAELALARGLGVAGSASPGSIEPFTVPHLIVGARLLHAAGSAVFDPESHTRGELRQVLGFYKALVYTQITTQLAKNIVHRARPDQSDSKSFFSGHTSTTFAMSSYLQREIDRAILSWEAVGDAPLLRNLLRGGSATLLYGWAGYVGYSRMRDNRHYLTDVLVGAAIGSLVGHLVYGQVNGAADDLPRVGVAAGADGPQVSLQMHF